MSWTIDLVIQFNHMKFKKIKKTNQDEKEEYWDKRKLSINLVVLVYEFSSSLKDFGKVVKKRLQMLLFESWLKLVEDYAKLGI